MLATVLIETMLFVYTLWRYKLSVTARLALLIVGTLAVFQVAEFQVCTGFGISAIAWSRLGYVAITFLPALGLHLMYVLAGKPGRKLVIVAYLTMIGFIAYFLTYKAAFIGYQCTGNYVIFQIGKHPAIAYGVYYYGWLLVAMGLGIKWIWNTKQRDEPVGAKIQTMRALIIGYLVFLIPTGIANSIKPETRRGIPSIMCGFAVLFALIVVLYILPRAAKRRK